MLLRMVWMVALTAGLAVANPLGKVNYVEGDAFLVTGGKERSLRVNQKVSIGSHIRTGAESVVELTYTKGTVVRIGEKSAVTLEGTEVAGNIVVQSGRVWANVQKLAVGQMRVTTPVATAAVRGTIFRVDASEDSSSTVALYEGKVDVGPADTTQIKAAGAPAASAWGPPVEVPGPYEVSMETWIRLDPGQAIHVKKGGKYATDAINEGQEAMDRWIAFNRKRDQDVKR